MKKHSVDTPRQGAWYTQVNQPGFCNPKPQQQRGIVIATISAKEARELSPILNGRG